MDGPNSPSEYADWLSRKMNAIIIRPIYNSKIDINIYIKLNKSFKGRWRKV